MQKSLLRPLFDFPSRPSYLGAAIRPNRRNRPVRGLQKIAPTSEYCLHALAWTEAEAAGLEEAEARTSSGAAKR